MINTRLFIILSLTLVTSSLHAQTLYTVEVLPSSSRLQSGYDSMYAAINNRWHVAYTWEAGTYKIAHYWISGPTTIPISITARTQNGYTRDIAGGINDAGVVVGSGHSSSEGREAFVWTRQSGRRYLGKAPGYGYSGAGSINNRGDISGGCYDSGIHSKGFIWPGGGPMQPLPLIPPSTAQSVSGGLNDLGHVAGSAMDHVPFPKRTTYVWKGGTPYRLPVPMDAIESYCMDINNNEQIVGEIVLPPFNSIKACFWEADGTFRYLPVIDNASVSRAMAMNNHGEVAGSIYGAGGAAATVWDAQSQPIVLHDHTDLDVYLHTATDINDYGQITAIGKVAGDNRIVYFRLTPVLHRSLFFK